MPATILDTEQMYMLDGNHEDKKQKYHKEMKEISSSIKKGF